jgi:adenylate cyclase
MELRIGIDIGDVIVEGDDLYGDGVNVASRLEGLAHPNGICISGTAYEQVRRRLDLVYEDLGEQSVKNIPEPIHVFRVLLNAGQTSEKATSSAETLFSRPAVAVLPFDNLSGDSEQEYFVDGLTEDIITGLSNWNTFPVIARNSTFVYKGQSTDIRQVGQELGARYVVEGSVRKAADRVRVTAQLINADTGHHVWAERYDRDLKDIFALQDEITQQVVGIIEPTIERSERERIATKGPTDLAAWEFVIRGYADIYEGSLERNEAARKLFSRAIELDPNYARAFTGLAYTYVKDIRFFRVVERQECLRLIFENARRALELNEKDVEARTILARAYIIDGQKEFGMAECRRAVESNPYDAYANNVFGAVLSLGSAQYEEGIPWFERALKLNPTDPQSHLFFAQLAIAKVGAERYEEALSRAQEALRLKTDYLEAHIALISAFGYLSRQDDALSSIKKYGEGAVEYVENHPFYADDLKERLIAGLRKAGLPE